MGDDQLLRYFIEGNSPEAFKRLVERHAPAVYAAALRQVRSHHLAEDVTQAVFISLATKAYSLRRRASLGGWLLKVTRYAAIDALRRQNVRSRHERASALERPEVNDLPSNPVEHVDLTTTLDDAMAGLTESDRSLVAMRFFEKLTLAQIGQRLNANVESIRKRVERALRRLRGVMERRGTTLSVAALTVGLASALDVGAQPMNAATIATRALEPPPFDLSSSAAHQIARATLRRLHTPALCATAVAGVVFLLLCGTGLYLVLSSAGSSSKPGRPVSSEFAAPLPPRDEPMAR